ncbi:hypothetical protein ACTWP5_00880 [Streptomyces sp. 4N509B]|uniref:hypothetical protein n=1 Tax=Streptomyces sp. 4N509B TaxID=3457413 RepID=UPI003FD5763A
MRSPATGPGLYVETRIGVDLAELWHRTQDPATHQRWDLRFTTITYLSPGSPPHAGADPSPEALTAAPRRFRYATRVLPFLVVSGTGVSAGERWRPDGTRTSALRFSSGHPLSLIAEGRGYWRYVPDGSGTVRFLTGYDYRPRWGAAGRVVDRLVFRPLMGWATAWSFDRLRLWCERGVTPERALRRALAELACRAGAVATAAPFLPVPAIALLAAGALLLPPLPGTPAARRCRRRPVRRSDATPPAVLGRLDAKESHA